MATIRTSFASTSARSLFQFRSVKHDSRTGISGYPNRDISGHTLNELRLVLIEISTDFESEFNPLVPVRSTEVDMTSYVKKPNGTFRVKTAKETVRDFNNWGDAIAAGNKKPGVPMPKRK